MNNAHEIPMPGVDDVTQTIIFKTLWDRVPKKSFVSGLWLRVYDNTPLWPNCFCRVLPERDFPYMRMYFGNIVLCTPSERALWMQAKEEDRISYALDVEEQSRGKSTCNWEGMKSLAEDLRALYKKEFPATRGIMVNYQYTLDDQRKILGRLNREFWENYYK